MISLVKSVAPTLHPVTPNEVKECCRVTLDTEPNMLDACIAAAVMEAERISWRQYVTATWVMKLDNFPTKDYILLPRPPLVSVTSITYVATGATTASTLSSTYYTVDTSTEPGRVFLNDGYSWPSVRGHYEDVVITYKAGYGSTEAAAIAAVPATDKLAIMQLAGHFYEHRTPFADGADPVKIPWLTEALLVGSRPPMAELCYLEQSE